MKKFITRIISLILISLMLVSCLPSEPNHAVTSIDSIISEMTTREKITQMFMISFRQWDSDTTDSASAADFTVMNDQVASIIEKYQFGSVILFANNIKETEQSYNLTQALQAAATKNDGIPLLIATDQEGGSVYRLGSGTALPGNMAIGATNDTECAKVCGQIIGSELSSLGINTTLAPVIDINNNANNPVIGLRSYSDSADIVGAMASATIEGLETYNVVACAKHFPGHGDTATDSHYGLPIVNKTREVLMENELKPYTIAIEDGVDMIMTAHILYPQLDDSTLYSEKTGQEESLPATLSKTIITDLLKTDMNFNGIVCTDAMNMSGISDSWTIEQASILAINAGVDLLCMPCNLKSNDDLETLESIISAIETAVDQGEIAESRLNDAVKRILTVKQTRGILDYNSSDYSLEHASNTVGCTENRQKEREIAAKAVTVIKNENNTLPLTLEETSKVLMLCPYENEQAQLAMGWNRAKEAGLIPEGAEMDYYRYSSTTVSSTLQVKLDWADTIIVISEVSSASRMAYQDWRSAAPNNFVNYASEQGKTSIIMSADKPYDVQLYPNSDATIAVYGCKGSSVDPTEALIGGITDSTSAYGPNIIAGIEVIFGVYGAQGTLPVNIPYFDADSSTYTDTILYQRGYGLFYDSLIAKDYPSLEQCSISLGYTTAVYSGTYKTPAVTVTAPDGTVLVKNQDYTVEYSNNKNVGTASVTVTGTGNYSGQQTVHFTITERRNIGDCTAKLNFTLATYNGNAKRPGVTVKTAKGTTLAKGKNYTVTYSNNVEVGTATVTITGIGKYKGTLVKTFRIRPEQPSGVKAASITQTKIKVQFNRVSSADRYYIYVNGTYKGCTFTKNYYTIKDLSSNTTYKIYVKAVKEVDGVKYYSKASSSHFITTN